MLHEKNELMAVASRPHTSATEILGHGFPRLRVPTGLLFALLILCTRHELHAQIVAEALSVFPEQTESFEYDNLVALRNLPNYGVIRRRFAGPVLRQTQVALTKLGIREDQVDELVLGSMSATFYGLFSGSFDGSLCAKAAQKRGVPALEVNGSKVFCPGGAVCFSFLENWLAAFGTADRLKSMLDARQGMTNGLCSKGHLPGIIYRMDQHAPVRVAALGCVFRSM